MNNTGEIKSISLDYETKKPVVTLMLNERGSIENLEKLKEDKLSIEIKKWYKKRSLNANAYCWVLCDEIAKVLSRDVIITKEDVYKDAILQIGTFQPMIVEEKAFENFKRIWEKQGLGFLVQEVSKKDKCVKVNAYYGSSTYDTREMSLLINLLVEEAKLQGIETKPREEIDSLLRSWDNEVNYTAR